MKTTQDNMRENTMSWDEAARLSSQQDGRNIPEIIAEHDTESADRKNLVAPLRESNSKIAGLREELEKAERERREHFHLQGVWGRMLEGREALLAQIAHGEARLAASKQLGDTTAEAMENWAAEELGGKVAQLNSYCHLQGAAAQVIAYVPSWLERQRTKLIELEREIKKFAKANGVTHLSPV